MDYTMQTRFGSTILKSCNISKNEEKEMQIWMF